MGADLDDVLAGEGVRSGKEGEDYSIGGAGGVDPRKRRMPGREWLSSLDQNARDLRRGRTTDPDDTDAASSDRCSNGDDRVIWGEHAHLVFYFLGEMITVLRNASPMLSDESCGSSATARWTSRRA